MACESLDKSDRCHYIEFIKFLININTSTESYYQHNSGFLYFKKLKHN